MRQVSLTFKIYGSSNGYLKTLSEDVHYALQHSTNRFKRVVYITAEKVVAVAIVILQTCCLPVIGCIAAIENFYIASTIHDKRGLVAAVKAALQFSKMVALGNVAPILSLFNSEKVYLAWMMYEKIVHSMATTLSCFPQTLAAALSELRLRAVQNHEAPWTPTWRQELADLLTQELTSEGFWNQDHSDAPLHISDYRQVFELLLAQHRVNPQPVVQNAPVIIPTLPAVAMEPSAPVLDDVNAPVMPPDNVPVPVDRNEMLRLFEAAYVEKTPCRNVLQELETNRCALDGKELMKAIIFQAIATVRHELIEREIYSADDIEEMGGSSYFGVLNLAILELARQKAFEWEERKLTFVSTVANEERTTNLSFLFDEAQVKAFTTIVTQYRAMNNVSRGVGRIDEEIRLLRGVLSRAKEYSFSSLPHAAEPNDSVVKGLFDSVGAFFSAFENRMLHENVGNENVKINLANVFKS